MNSNRFNIKVLFKVGIYKSWGSKVTMLGNELNLFRKILIRDQIIVLEWGFIKLFKEADVKQNLWYFNQLAHYKQEAKYLPHMVLNWRRDLAGFRLGSRKYKHRRDKGGNRICVICAKWVWKCRTLSAIRAKLCVCVRAELDMPNDERKQIEQMDCGY